MRIGRNLKKVNNEGFTYIAMLLALALFSIGLAAIGEFWSAVSRRDKEDELIRIGNIYISAIEKYYLDSPGATKTYPKTLDDLIEDKRFVGTKRYLRQIPRDPTNNYSQEWGTIETPDGGGIMGVYSLSNKQPLHHHVQLKNEVTVSGQYYSEWKFIYIRKS